MRTLLATALALTLFGHGAALAQTSPPQAKPPQPAPQAPPKAQPPPQTAQTPPATTPAAPGATFAKPAVPGPVVATEPGFTIGPEDVVGIIVWREAEVSGDVSVRPDGMITLPLVRDIRAAGLTPNELADRIQEALLEFITDPSVTVVVRQMNSRKVFITGEVAKPGAYAMPSSMTVMQLIAVSGGINEFADANAISVMRVEGGKTRTFKFEYKEVAKGKKPEQNIVLRPGDTVVVPEK
jgi:polysaccharide export outer membrane protein